MDKHEDSFGLDVNHLVTFGRIAGGILITLQEALLNTGVIETAHFGTYN